MKRTTLMVNEETLKQATRLLGAKTYSEAVNRALEETIRIAKIQGLAELMGKDVWSGELSQMREDVPKKKKRKRS